VQTDVDHPADSGVDILNLATAGDNAFEGNICMTSVNAPCSSLGPSLTANPNPIPINGNVSLGATTLSWSAPDAQVIEIHIGSPNGKIFTQYGNRGSMQTATWVTDGMMFYLQDVTAGKPLTSDYTLATLVVHLQTGGANGSIPLRFGSGPRWWAAGTASVLLGFIVVWIHRGSRRRRLLIAVGGAALFAGIAFTFVERNAKAQPQTSAQEPSATLDRMIAAHKSQPELAQYVFATHGCNNCHTVGRDGKLGFTSRGKQVAGDFEGCIRLLTDMNLIAQTPENRRSNQERQKAARFEEFGCTFCHKVTPTKMGLTDAGAKLRNLHLGCVDVEKLVARGQ
jgi:hypothetical protein